MRPGFGHACWVVAALSRQNNELEQIPYGKCKRRSAICSRVQRADLS